MSMRLKTLSNISLLALLSSLCFSAHAYASTTLSHKLSDQSRSHINDHLLDHPSHKDKIHGYVVVAHKLVPIINAAVLKHDKRAKAALLKLKHYFPKLDETVFDTVVCFRMAPKAVTQFASIGIKPKPNSCQIAHNDANEKILKYAKNIANIVTHYATSAQSMDGYQISLSEARNILSAQGITESQRSDLFSMISLNPLYATKMDVAIGYLQLRNSPNYKTYLAKFKLNLPNNIQQVFKQPMSLLNKILIKDQKLLKKLKPSTAIAVAENVVSLYGLIDKTNLSKADKALLEKALVTGPPNNLMLQTSLNAILNDKNLEDKNSALNALVNNIKSNNGVFNRLGLSLQDATSINISSPFSMTGMSLGDSDTNTNAFQYEQYAKQMTANSESISTGLNIINKLGLSSKESQQIQNTLLMSEPNSFELANSMTQFYNGVVNNNQINPEVKSSLLKFFNSKLVADTSASGQQNLPELNALTTKVVSNAKNYTSALNFINDESSTITDANTIKTEILDNNSNSIDLAKALASFQTKVMNNSAISSSVKNMLLKNFTSQVSGMITNKYTPDALSQINSAAAVPIQNAEALQEAINYVSANQKTFPQASYVLSDLKSYYPANLAMGQGIMQIMQPILKNKSIPSNLKTTIINGYMNQLEVQGSYNNGLTSQEIKQYAQNAIGATQSIPAAISIINQYKGQISNASQLIAGLQSSYPGSSYLAGAIVSFENNKINPSYFTQGGRFVSGLPSTQQQLNAQFIQSLGQYVGTANGQTSVTVTNTTPPSGIQLTTAALNYLSLFNNPQDKNHQLFLAYTAENQQNLAPVLQQLNSMKLLNTSGIPALANSTQTTLNIGGKTYTAQQLLAYPFNTAWPPHVSTLTKFEDFWKSVGNSFIAPFEKNDGSVLNRIFGIANDLGIFVAPLTGGASVAADLEEAGTLGAKAAELGEDTAEGADLAAESSAKTISATTQAGKVAAIEATSIVQDGTNFHPGEDAIVNKADPNPTAKAQIPEDPVISQSVNTSKETTSSNIDNLSEEDTTDVTKTSSSQNDADKQLAKEPKKSILKEGSKPGPRKTTAFDGMYDESPTSLTSKLKTSINRTLEKMFSSTKNVTWKSDLTQVKEFSDDWRPVTEQDTETANQIKQDLINADFKDMTTEDLNTHVSKLKYYSDYMSKLMEHGADDNNDINTEDVINEYEKEIAPKAKELNHALADKNFQLKTEAMKAENDMKASFNDKLSQLNETELEQTYKKLYNAESIPKNTSADLTEDVNVTDNTEDSFDIKDEINKKFEQDLKSNSISMQKSAGLSNDEFNNPMRKYTEIGLLDENTLQKTDDVIAEYHETALNSTKSKKWINQNSNLRQMLDDDKNLKAVGYDDYSNSQSEITTKLHDYASPNSKATLETKLQFYANIQDAEGKTANAEVKLQDQINQINDDIQDIESKVSDSSSEEQIAKLKEQRLSLEKSMASLNDFKKSIDGKLPEYFTAMTSDTEALQKLKPSELQQLNDIGDEVKTQYAKKIESLKEANQHNLDTLAKSGKLDDYNAQINAIKEAQKTADEKTVAFDSVNETLNNLSEQYNSLVDKQSKLQADEGMVLGRGMRINNIQNKLTTLKNQIDALKESEEYTGLKQARDVAKSNVSNAKAQLKSIKAIGDDGKIVSAERIYNTDKDSQGEISTLEEKISNIQSNQEKMQKPTGPGSLDMNSNKVLPENTNTNTEITKTARPKTTTLDVSSDAVNQSANIMDQDNSSQSPNSTQSYNMSSPTTAAGLSYISSQASVYNNILKAQSQSQQDRLSKAQKERNFTEMRAANNQLNITNVKKSQLKSYLGQVIVKTMMAQQNLINTIKTKYNYQRDNLSQTAYQYMMQSYTGINLGKLFESMSNIASGAKLKPSEFSRAKSIANNVVSSADNLINWQQRVVDSARSKAAPVFAKFNLAPRLSNADKAIDKALSNVKHPHDQQNKLSGDYSPDVLLKELDVLKSNAQFIDDAATLHNYRHATNKLAILKNNTRIMKQIDDQLDKISPNMSQKSRAVTSLEKTLKNYTPQNFDYQPFQTKQMQSLFNVPKQPDATKTVDPTHVKSSSDGPEAGKQDDTKR